MVKHGSKVFSVYCKKTDKEEFPYYLSKKEREREFDYIPAIQRFCIFRFMLWILGLSLELGYCFLTKSVQVKFYLSQI
jgi:hypothetical protein